MPVSPKIIAFFIVSLCLVHTSFAAKGPLKNKAQIAFLRAAELEKSSRYEEALLEFQNVESTYPYSIYAKKSKLHIADIHFSMTSYIQAQYQYQLYYELFPSGEKSDYALFRVGYSLYKQLPKTIDRDLSQISEILGIWRRVLVKFAKSEHTKEILDLQAELLNRLGKKELYIADFYKKQKRCLSAHRRYKSLFIQFPKFKKNKDALTNALACAKEIGDDPLVKKYSLLLEGL